MSSVKNAVLTDELIEVITGYDPKLNVQAFRNCKETCARNLRHQRFGRTNQFQVQQNLDGLIERLTIINKEPLANALEARLDELQAREDSQWRPEILSLLLHLADRPAELSRLENLERIRPRNLEAEKLTWREIVGDEEADADALWGKLDAEEEGDPSEGEYYANEEASSSDETDPTSTSVFSSVDEGLRLDSLLLEPDTGSLAVLRQAQQWRSANDDGYAEPLTEDDAVREILHMLRGLPSPLFVRDEPTGRLRASSRLYIETLSSQGFVQLLDNFARIGDTLDNLRQYMSRRQDSALQETFAQSIEQELRVLYQTLSTIESTIAKPRGSTPVSFFDMQDQIETAVYTMMSMATITDLSLEDGRSPDLDILNHLYGQVCEAQAKGDANSFSVLQTTFSNCLHTYLRPIQAWIITGILHDDVSFSRQRHETVDISTFWERQYSLHTRDGQVLAPEFMREFVPMIFSLGKQVAFMEVLGVSVESQEEVTNHMRDSLSVVNLEDLTPYPTTVARALHAWLQGHRQHSSIALCNHILHVCGLSRALDTLAHIYLSANGSLFQLFADSIFARLDAGKSTWADSLTLETLARESFAGILGVGIRNLSAQQHQSTQDIKFKTLPQNVPASVKALSSINLTLEISPALQNIIRPSQIKIYQSASHLLLQLYRATSSLATLDVTSLKHANISLPLRQRLLHLITTIRSHVLHAGIGAASTVLKEQMIRAQGVDEMISAHAVFVAKLELCCFVSPDATVTNARKLVVSLCDVAVNFAKLWRTSHQEIRADLDPGSGSNSSDDEEGVAPARGSSTAGAEEVSPVRLRQMLKQVDHVQLLLISTLRSADRNGLDEFHDRNGDAGSSQDFGMLAEELESSLRPLRRRTTSSS